MYWFINDHLGTPQKIVNNSGQVVWAAAYLPFGKAQVTVETVENHFRFPGQYFDAESGLHYNWHRYYDPETGRYITADPIGLAGGDINIYRYVFNNPVNLTDVIGLGKGCKVPPPQMPEKWKECTEKAVKDYCGPATGITFEKVRCKIWAESTDNPMCGYDEQGQPLSNVHVRGLSQVYWKIWTPTCSKLPGFVKETDPCSQIICGVYILCAEYKGDLKKYGTVIRPGGCYDRCISAEE